MDYCALLFDVDADGSLVHAFIGWEGGAGIPAELMDTDRGEQACACAHEYLQQKPLKVRRLLEVARRMYEDSGATDLGHFPEVTVLQPPLIDRNKLTFRLSVDGNEVEGVLCGNCRWHCRGLDERSFASAYHCALLYAVDNRDALVRLGFESSEIDQQIAEP